VVFSFPGIFANAVDGRLVGGAVVIVEVRCHYAPATLHGGVNVFTFANRIVILLLPTNNPRPSS
jgi:hypothetical protein